MYIRITCLIDQNKYLGNIWMQPTIVLSAVSKFGHFFFQKWQLFDGKAYAFDFQFGTMFTTDAVKTPSP